MIPDCHLKLTTKNKTISLFSLYLSLIRWNKPVSQSKNYDFIIAGGGIVGLSVAHELSARYPSAKIAVLEKESDIGVHASGRNSGVLHSGIYYGQDSLKARVCSEGARRMFQFAKDHNIACRKTGKVIIAANDQDLITINSLLKNAADNKITAHLLDEMQIKELEPHASPYKSGIYTPDTASIDSKSVLRKVHDIVVSRGVEIHLGQKVVSVDHPRLQLKTSRGDFGYGYLFNCAGSGTDQIAKMTGLAKEYTLLPFKGIYYKVSKEKNHLVNGNIYPVPDLKLPFLGVHFTRVINGDVYVGPTAIPAFGRENYGLLQGINSEAFRIIKDICLMYAANQQNFRALMHAEMKKYIKPYFMNTARKLVASIQPQDLLPSNKVGIRPQLINVAKRKIEMDYIIEQDANSMHVLNAISPAFTSAFAFAELLVNRM